MKTVPIRADTVLRSKIAAIRRAQRPAPDNRLSLRSEVPGSVPEQRGALHQSGIPQVRMADLCVRAVIPILVPAVGGVRIRAAIPAAQAVPFRAKAGALRDSVPPLHRAA